MSLVRDPKIEAALMLRKGIEQYGKVDFPLVGADGNAHNLIWASGEALKRGGWPKKFRNAFSAVAYSGDYNHVLRTCMSVSANPFEERRVKLHGA
jgi:hypothetical protein